MGKPSSSFGRAASSQQSHRSHNNPPSQESSPESQSPVRLFLGGTKKARKSPTADQQHCTKTTAKMHKLIIPNPARNGPAGKISLCIFALDAVRFSAPTAGPARRPAVGSATCPKLQAGNFIRQQQTGVPPAPWQVHPRRNQGPANCRCSNPYRPAYRNGRGRKG